MSKFGFVIVRDGEVLKWCEEKEDCEEYLGTGPYGRGRVHRDYEGGRVRAATEDEMLAGQLYRKRSQAGRKGAIRKRLKHRRWVEE